MVIQSAGTAVSTARMSDWRICTSLTSGSGGKESVENLKYCSAAVLRMVLTPLAAASLLVFSLAGIPCA